MSNARADKFWKHFASANPEIDASTPFQVWYFGNKSGMARDLAKLVLSGKKTATASLVETNRLEPANAPADNGYSVVTDFDGDPLCIIQTIEIREIPFEDVDAGFAFDEGEGDRTLTYWREVHWQYFSREAAEKGFDFNEDSLICCERFRLLFP